MRHQTTSWSGLDDKKKKKKHLESISEGIYTLSFHNRIAIQNIQWNKYNPIPKWMTPMSRFFLVDQKHSTTSVVRFPNRLLWVFFLVKQKKSELNSEETAIFKRKPNQNC